MSEKKKLLLHSCCGPCSTSVLESLREEFDTTVFFYNPNIMDEKEYERRLEAQKQVCKEEEALAGKCPLIEGPYDSGVYRDFVIGMEHEPEGGARCTVCFRLRMEETARQAALLGYDAFGTTLSVSPHKNYQLLSVLGQELSMLFGVEFLDRDFKKKNGYGRSVELSRAYGLYRQNFCGCDFAR